MGRARVSEGLGEGRNERAKGFERVDESGHARPDPGGVTAGHPGEGGWVKTRDRCPIGRGPRATRSRSSVNVQRSRGSLQERVRGSE